MEIGKTTIPSAMKDKFIEHLIKNTIPWEKRPFIPAGAGKIICKTLGDTFTLQEDGHSAPRPIVNCQVTQVGPHCEITWSEAPQYWFKIYFAIWCSVLWFMILSGYFAPSDNVIYKAPFLGFLAGGFFMTAIGFVIVMFNNYLAHSRARRLGEFLCRLSSEVANTVPKP